MHKRVAAVIIKNNKILLLRRVKRGRQYFIFPRGKAQIKESFEAAIKRVIKKEFGIEIVIETFLFRLGDRNRTEFYFLVQDFTGEPHLCGEEKQIINDNNQYYLEWKNLSELDKLTNLLPSAAKKRIVSEFKKSKILV